MYFAGLYAGIRYIILITFVVLFVVVLVHVVAVFIVPNPQALHIAAVGILLVLCYYASILGFLPVDPQTALMSLVRAVE